MTLINQLNTLESTGLVRLINAQPNVEYIFRHALIHDAVHDSLVKRDRVELHALVGATLEQVYPDRLSSPDLAAVLAQHFDQGQEHRRAVMYYTLSGDAAYDTFANLEAIAYYSRAIELAEHTPISPFQLLHVYTRRGRARELIGQYEAALKDYRKLETVAQQRGDRSIELHALILQATVLAAPTSVRNHEQGEATSNRALVLARELSDRAAESKLLWTLLLVHRHSGDLNQALAYGEQAAAIAREYNLSEQLAFVLNDLQPVYQMFDRQADSVANLHEAQAIWRENQNLPMLADSLSTEAMMAFFSGDYDRTVRLSEEAQQLSERIGNLWNQSYSRYVAGYIFLDRGEPDRAIEIMRAAVDYGRQAGFIFALVQTQADIGFVYAALGDYARSLEYGQRALADARKSFPQGITYSLGLLAYVSVMTGQLEQAQTYMREAQHDYSLNELSMIAYFTPMAETEIALINQDYERVGHITDQALALLKSFGLRPFRQDAYYYKALAEWHLGHSAEALALLAQATQIAQSLNSRRVLWEIDALWADIEQARGNALEAYKLRAQAREIINYIAAHISQPELRASFLNLPRVRQVIAAI